MTKTVVLVLAAAAAGLAVGYCWMRPEPLPTPATAQVDPGWLEQLRPEAKQGLWGRLRDRPIAPVATYTAPPTAEGVRRVQAYCTPAVVPVLVGPRIELAGGAIDDTAAAEVGRPPSILPDFRARSSRHRLELYSTLSDGSGWARTYRLPSDRWELGTDADSTWLRGERWWPRAWRAARRCVIAGAAGFLVGSLGDQPEAAAALACGATTIP